MTDAQRSARYGKPGARTHSNRTRAVGTMHIRPRLLIVCEGAKTETNYFLAFKVTQEVYGKGLNTTSLIAEAERRQRADGPFDQIWCVFDRDSFPADDFNRAIELAAGKGFRVAYSNEAFELWYLLHFSYRERGAGVECPSLPRWGRRTPATPALLSLNIFLKYIPQPFRV